MSIPLPNTCNLLSDINIKLEDTSSWEKMFNWFWNKRLPGKTKREREIDCEKPLLLWKMKHVKVNTFIHSFRKWVHIISGLAQFKHPKSVPVTTETPHCSIWWNSDGGYAVLACIRYVYDSKTPMRLWKDVYLPSLPTDSTLWEASVIGLYHSAP